MPKNCKALGRERTNELQSPQKTRILLYYRELLTNHMVDETAVGPAVEQNDIYR